MINILDLRSTFFTTNTNLLLLHFYNRNQLTTIVRMIFCDDPPIFKRPCLFKTRNLFLSNKKKEKSINFSVEIEYIEHTVVHVLHVLRLLHLLLIDILQIEINEQIKFELKSNETNFSKKSSSTSLLTSNNGFPIPKNDPRL